MEEMAGHGNGEWNLHTVKIVDFNTKDKNVLVRGGTAFGASNFAIGGEGGLVSAIQADPNYGKLGFTISSNPLIIDFCLIGFGPTNHKDHKIVDREAAYFNSTPPDIKGATPPYPTIVGAVPASNTMVYWPILSIGGTVPCSAGKSWSNAHAVDISITADNAAGYNFDGLVAAINAALNNEPASISPALKINITNAIIYVHCDSGVNRTGAAITGYLLKHGSNISSLSLPVTGCPHTLGAVQTALAQISPQGDSNPPGGSDQPVAMAYCNYIASGETNAKQPLALACVPNANTVKICQTTE